MGWIALYKDGTELREDAGAGRPVQDGDEGKLLVIAQEDYGNNVAVDLVNGVIHLGYESLEYTGDAVNILGSKSKFWICEDSNIIGTLSHVKSVLSDYRDENGRKVINEEGRFTQVQTHVFTPLTWRPIWLTRFTNGDPTKIIGAQTTTPIEYGGRNVKKMVFLFSDGSIGID